MALPRSIELDILMKYSQRLTSWVDFFKSLTEKYLTLTNQL